MPNTRITESRIKALKPRKTPYDIRDGELKGFGVLLLPSGASRFFIHSQNEGRCLWKTISSEVSKSKATLCQAWEKWCEPIRPALGCENSRLRR